MAGRPGRDRRGADLCPGETGRGAARRLARRALHGDKPLADLLRSQALGAHPGGFQRPAAPAGLAGGRPQPPEGRLLVSCRGGAAGPGPHPGAGAGAELARRAAGGAAPLVAAGDGGRLGGRRRDHRPISVGAGDALAGSRGGRSPERACFRIGRRRPQGRSGAPGGRRTTCSPAPASADWRPCPRNAARGGRR